MGVSDTQQVYLKIICHIYLVLLINFIWEGLYEEIVNNPALRDVTKYIGMLCRDK